MLLNWALVPMRSISHASCLVLGRQRPVLVLDGQLADALEHRVDLVQLALSGLHEGDGVGGVAVGLVEARDLSTQLLADRESGRVVSSGVDSVAR
jgi:hypothetical protein